MRTPGPSFSDSRVDDRSVGTARSSKSPHGCRRRYSLRFYSARFTTTRSLGCCRRIALRKGRSDGVVRLERHQIRDAAAEAFAQFGAPIDSTVPGRTPSASSGSCLLSLAPTVYRAIWRVPAASHLFAPQCLVRDPIDRSTYGTLRDLDHGQREAPDRFSSFGLNIQDEPEVQPRRTQIIVQSLACPFRRQGRSRDGQERLRGQRFSRVAQVFRTLGCSGSVRLMAASAQREGIPSASAP